MTKPDALEKMRGLCRPMGYGYDETQTWLGDARMEGIIACAEVLEERIRQIEAEPEYGLKPKKIGPYIVSELRSLVLYIRSVVEAKDGC